MNSLISTGLLLFVFLQYHCIGVEECTTQTCPELQEEVSDLFRASKMRDNIDLNYLQFKSLLRNYLNVTFDKLSTKQKQSLANDGYMIIENMLSKQDINELKTVYDGVLQFEQDSAGYEAYSEEGAVILGDLVNKGSIFDKLWLDPFVLECMENILGYFKLSSLNGRHALKGYGLQSLHSDTTYLNIFEWDSTDINAWIVANAVWLLDDFNQDNGAIRIVPRSHLLNKHPCKIVENARDKHEKEVVIQAKAGCIVIYNGHVWHGCSNNECGKERRSIHANYVTRGGYSQQSDQCFFLRPSTSSRLSYAQHMLLDCVPF